MRDPKPKKQTAPSTHARDYSRTSPSASVYLGRQLLGFLIDTDRRCVAALDADRGFIGVFPDHKSASLAILRSNQGGAAND
jgi:hypothetical protein